MAELKTRVNDAASVDAFINSVEDEEKRRDCLQIMKMMKQAARAEPKMWGTSIVGFGNYHYKYASGREGDWMLTGFSPRRQNITLYIMTGFERYGDLLKKLGKHTSGVSCLYIKRLKDVDVKVLKELVSESVKAMKNP
jgi:hypothetical protein